MNGVRLAAIQSTGSAGEPAAPLARDGDSKGARVLSAGAQRKGHAPIRLWPAAWGKYSTRPVRSARERERQVSLLGGHLVGKEDPDQARGAISGAVCHPAMQSVLTDRLVHRSKHRDPAATDEAVHEQAREP